MTAHPQRWRAQSSDCASGKVGYPNRDEAKRVAKRLNRRLRAFQCPVCPMWHLGRLPKATVRGKFQPQLMRVRQEDASEG